jgi:hypothetical protein
LVFSWHSPTGYVLFDELDADAFEASFVPAMARASCFYDKIS